MLNDEWRVGMVKEIIDVRNSNLEIENFVDEELEEILHYVCTS